MSKCLLGDSLFDQSDANQIKRKKDWRSIIKMFLVKMGPKGNYTNELWFTIPYHLRPNNTRIISMVICLHSEKIKGRKKKDEAVYDAVRFRASDLYFSI